MGCSQKERGRGAAVREQCGDTVQVVANPMGPPVSSWAKTRRKRAAKAEAAEPTPARPKRQRRAATLARQESHDSGVSSALLSTGWPHGSAEQRGATPEAAAPASAPSVRGPCLTSFADSHTIHKQFGHPC